ncbi:hypothetical protein SLEP1_g33067 [Rubroshorea leprosula]|uniref:Ribosomal protein eL8/eL30/eS12/Gadd45 domain-containing protein n=1 Tax=Rubroshorea leprosula TaxID=152421 RepID=A0AAV5KFJ7_9ROSI|nr:hypothetical protein SLEP1_g33067 [Rubroshorea leprosula]
MPGRNKASEDKLSHATQLSALPQERECYEGERLVLLLKSIQRGIESSRALDGNTLPEKIWFKQQFAVGVNDVTRVLERMAPSIEAGSSHHKPNVLCSKRRAPSVQLQAVLLAADCNPKGLTKHLPGLASSRKVPLIFIKDNKMGSLRLGELVKIKTAIAIGVKVQGNTINQIIEQILHGDEVNHGALAELL